MSLRFIVLISSRWRAIIIACIVAALWLPLPVSTASAAIVASIDIDGVLTIASDANDTIRLTCSGDTLKVTGALIGDPPVMCPDVLRLRINAGAGDDRILLDRWGGDAGIFPNLNSPVTISDGGGIDLIDCSEAPTGLVLSVDQEGLEQEPFTNGTIVIFTGQFENVVGTVFDDELSLNLIPVERYVDGGAHENGDLLIVNGDCLDYTDDGAVIIFSGREPINYTGIESIMFICLPVDEITWGQIKSLYN